MTEAAHEFMHGYVAAGDDCRICVRRKQFLGVLEARKRQRQEHNLLLAIFPCPACYDGEMEVSTGLVLGGICRVCDGTKIDPRIWQPKSDKGDTRG